MLKYQAALALYQQVQLMNRQVQNATQMKCYAPFLVQMKLSLLPYRRNLPYDMHGRVSFFPGKLSDKAPLASLRLDLKKAKTDPCAESDLPFIVPLLVTDDIERAIKSRANETAQQIGFALSAMVQGVGVNAGVNNLKQALDTVSGQDFNSRYTVARLADNTLYVRIGAANQASGGSALVGQTYDVSLLLLVPTSYFGTDKKQPTIRVVTHTEFRKAGTGQILPARGRPALVATADMVMRDVLQGDLLAAWNAASEADKQALAQKLACPIQIGSYDVISGCGDKITSFEDFLKDTTLKTPQGKAVNFGPDYLPKAMHEAFWTRLSVILADSAFKSAFFPLPVPPVVRVPEQTALLQDDSKESTLVLLREVTEPPPRPSRRSSNSSTRRVSVITPFLRRA
jgi:hypothetical protein